MAAALAITAGRTRTGTTIALTGAGVLTNYLFELNLPSGSLQTIPAQTNGFGAVTVTAIICEPGTLKVNVTTVPTAVLESGPVSALITA